MIIEMFVETTGWPELSALSVLIDNSFLCFVDFYKSFSYLYNNDIGDVFRGIEETVRVEIWNAINTNLNEPILLN